MSIFSGQDMLEEFLHGYLDRPVAPGDLCCETTETSKGEHKTQVSYGTLDGLLVPAACGGTLWESPFASSQAACSTALQNFGRLFRLCILQAREAGLDLASRLPPEVLAAEGEAAATEASGTGPFLYTEVPPPPPLPPHLQHLARQPAPSSDGDGSQTQMNSPPPNPAVSATERPDPVSGLRVLQRHEAWQDRRTELNEAVQRYLDRAIHPDDLTWEFEGGGTANYVATLFFTFPEDMPKGPGWRGLPAANKGKAKASASSLAYDWLMQQLEGRAAPSTAQDRPSSRPNPPGSQHVGKMPPAVLEQHMAHLQEDRNWSGLLREFMQGRLRRLLTEEDLKLETEPQNGGQVCQATVNYKGLTIVEVSAAFAKKKEAEREACAKVYLSLMRQLQMGKGR